MIKKDFLKGYFSIYGTDGCPLTKGGYIVSNTDNHILGIILYSLARRKQLKF